MSVRLHERENGYKKKKRAIMSVEGAERGTREVGGSKRHGGTLWTGRRVSDMEDKEVLGKKKRKN